MPSPVLEKEWLAMTDKQAEPAAPAAPTTPAMPAAPAPLTAPEKPDALSLAMNGVPAVLLLTGIAGSLLLWHTLPARIAAMLAWLYLAPPVLARLLILCCGKPTGRLTLQMPAYRTWWLLTQLQLPFNRLPWLEEGLRLVPGLYAAWIRLWGGNLSALAFVGPGVCITDRHLVRVERGAVLGLHSTLAGHAVVRDAAGRFLIIAAEPVVESHAILGGRSAVGPGATVHAGHLLPAGRLLSPFSEWPKMHKQPCTEQENA